MPYGLGILLIVVGLVFALDVINADTSAVDGQALGWILVFGGILAIVLPLLITQNRTRQASRTVVEAPPTTTRRVVEERRVEDPPL
jgi:hypothetical protein